MDELIARLRQLSSANEFLEFFGIDYDARVVDVHRLHILKRFYQYLHQERDLEALDGVEMFRRYRALLTRAYQDFTTSTAAREKVFKVFQDVGGTQHVSVDALRSALAERRAA